MKDAVEASLVPILCTREAYTEKYLFRIVDILSSCHAMEVESTHYGSSAHLYVFT